MMTMPNNPEPELKVKINLTAIEGRPPTSFEFTVPTIEPLPPLEVDITPEDMRLGREAQVSGSIYNPTIRWYQDGLSGVDDPPELFDSEEEYEEDDTLGALLDEWDHMVPPPNAPPVRT